MWRLLIRMFFTRAAKIKTIANRTEWIIDTVDGYELTLVRRDTSLPDAHSREEVVEMLRTVRQAERRLGWTCPEPSEE